MATVQQTPFRGTYTALVTPHRDGEVDWPALDELVDRQIVAGVDGVVPCGSTGESATLTHDEHDRVVDAVISRVASRCKILAGAGSNNTTEAIRLARHAAEAGADGALLVTPYYNRPTQEGLFRHYSAIAESVDLPLVLYNVPIRCGVDLQNDTVIRLAERYSNIVALKDASGGVDRVSDLSQRSDIDVLCGDDSLTLAMMTLGAVGVISVIANLDPAGMKALVDFAAAGEFEQARRCHRKVCGLADEIGCFGPNPLPIKTAMAAKGWIADEFRLPMCSLDADRRTKIESILRKYELL